MRDTNQLHPRLQLMLFRLLIECQNQGLNIRITECLRTVAEQDALYAQGRFKPGKIVTNVKGSDYGSMHQWGVAADFCRNDGRGAYDDSDGFFTKVGRIGQSIGLEWGGSWTSPVDKPHFQLPDWGSTPSKLKSLYKTPEAFFKTWEKIDANTYTVVKASYVRKSPNGDRIQFEDLPVILKGKCKKNLQGYAIMKKGSTFERKKGIHKDKDVWAKIAQGVYFPEKYKGVVRAKKTGQ